MHWDDTSAKTSCTTTCNVEGTRERVTISFGLNQPWKAGQQEIPAQLTDCIILSPQSTEQLALLLIKVLREYEARFRSVQAPGA